MFSKDGKKEEEVPQSEKDQMEDVNKKLSELEDKRIEMLVDVGGVQHDGRIKWWSLWRADQDGDIPHKISDYSRFGAIYVLEPDGGINQGEVTLPLQNSERLGFVLSMLSLLLLGALDLKELCARS